MMYNSTRSKRRRKKKPKLSPLERAEYILPFPSKIQINTGHCPVPDFTDWHKPDQIVRRKRRSSLIKIRDNIASTSKNTSFGWAADTCRLAHGYSTVGVLDTVKAASVLQNIWRLRTWRKHCTQKFKTLVKFREIYEHDSTVRIQCMVRKYAAIDKVQNKRKNLHNKMVNKIQRTARNFLRNQYAKSELRKKLLQTIRPLVPSSNRISELFSHSRRQRPSRSHRGGIQHRELEVLRELAGVAVLRPHSHSTFFVELLDTIRWVHVIRNTVHKRHNSYKNRRQSAITYSADVLEHVVRQRVLAIESFKVRQALYETIQEQCQRIEEKKERDERERMWREDNTIKFERLRLELVEKQKQLTKERQEREERERMWRCALLNKKRLEGIAKLKTFATQCCQLSIEQGMYLAILAIEGKRNVQR